MLKKIDAFDVLRKLIEQLDKEIDEYERNAD